MIKHAKSTGVSTYIHCLDPLSHNQVKKKKKKNRTSVDEVCNFTAFLWLKENIYENYTLLVNEQKMPFPCNAIFLYILVVCLGTLKSIGLNYVLHILCNKNGFRP